MVNVHSIAFARSAAMTPANQIDQSGWNLESFAVVCDPELHVLVIQNEPNVDTRAWAWRKIFTSDCW